MAGSGRTADLDADQLSEDSNESDSELVQDGAAASGVYIQHGLRNEANFSQSIKGPVIQFGKENTINICSETQTFQVKVSSNHRDVQAIVSINMVLPDEVPGNNPQRTLPQGMETTQQEVTSEQTILVRIESEELSIRRTRPRTRRILRNLFKHVNLIVNFFHTGSIIIGLRPKEHALFTFLNALEERFIQEMVRGILENEPDWIIDNDSGEPIKMMIDVNVPKKMLPKDFSCKTFLSIKDMLQELNLTVQIQEREEKETTSSTQTTMDSGADDEVKCDELKPDAESESDRDQVSTKHKPAYEEPYYMPDLGAPTTDNRSKMATAEKLPEDFLTCSICFDALTKPVSLDCKHSFCLKCLKEYSLTKEEAVLNKSIPCPKCRYETQVPDPERPVEEWAEQLKPSLLLTEVMDSKDHCSLCKEDGKTIPSTHECSECEASLCDGCLQQHNRIPICKKHKVIQVAANNSQQKNCTGKEHCEKIKFFCKDHNKPLCTVCYSIDHMWCKEVNTLADQVKQVKIDLQESQKLLAKKMKLSNVRIDHIIVQKQNLLTERSTYESEISKCIKEATDRMIHKVKEQTKEDTKKLTSIIKSAQIDLQLYRQQSWSIQQTLELEGGELIEKHLSSEARVVPDVTETEIEDIIYAVDIIPELDNLKTEIEKIGLRKNRDLVLEEYIETNQSCYVTDGVIMDIADVEVTVVADYSTQNLQSFYPKEGQASSSLLELPGIPWCITVISEGEVAVSLLDSHSIITVAVTPDLELLSTIQTSKIYRGLSSLNNSKLLASSDDPSSVDLIDMKGTILKTFTTLPDIGKSFINPRYIHVTRKGTILVSDSGLNSVICLTLDGRIVFTYTATGGRTLSVPSGITSTSEGQILVADYETHKVIQLSESGEFIRYILTSADGLEYPTGLYFDGDKLCVTLRDKGIFIYRFGEECI